MWYVLLAGSILTSKTLRFQTEYMGTRNTKVTVHGVPVDITVDRIGAFFAQYGKVEEVSGVISKANIATGNIVLQVTLIRRSFADIPNILVSREKRMLVVVEGHIGCVEPQVTWRRHAPVRT